MQVKTILNRLERQAGLRYGDVTLLEEGSHLVLGVDIWPRAKSLPICSGCGHPGPGYDTLPPRMFEFVPFWNIAVFFAYALRRVNCPRCGVKVEQVPWAEGKNILTRTYMQFLAIWAKRLSWKETAVGFRTTWEKVFRSVAWAVQWGLAHRDLSNVQSIGVDEVLWQRGHKYLTVVYQIDSGRCAPRSSACPRGPSPSHRPGTSPWTSSAPCSGCGFSSRSRTPMGRCDR